MFITNTKHTKKKEENSCNYKKHLSGLATTCELKYPNILTVETGRSGKDKSLGKKQVHVAKTFIKDNRDQRQYL